MLDTPIPMTRARLFVLIDSFERDMRSLLERFVYPDMDEQAVLGGLFEKASSRRSDDEAGTLDTPLVHYLDLRESYDLLNRHRSCLPQELAREIRECTPGMDRLVGIRKRVMHARPLLADDGEAAPMILNQFSTKYWSETRRVLSQLDADPAWEPEVVLRKSDSLTLHNLPLPDYDETGLIGRSTEVSDVVKLVKRGREAVITITGEGGIGKTALALEIAYALVDDPERPFEAVLWTSLKYERMTAQGIREIANAARDITNAMVPLGKALDNSFSGSILDLADALDGFRTLIVLDNLETIGGLDFGRIYEELPDSVSYLVTSRVGVGEYERRYPLAPLSKGDSIRLLNDFIRARRLDSLRALSGPTRSEVVERLRHSPLAIRWFVLAVEAGRDPVALIRDQSELLEFCVRSVYEELSDSGKLVLSALSVLGRPVTSDELVVLLDENADCVNIGLQELIRGSLVRRDSSSSTGGVSLQVRVTETANQFLEKRIIVDREFARLVATREREYRENEERRASDANSRSLAPIVVRTTGPHDVPTAQILRKALLASQDGNLNAGLNDVATARQLNPDLWEVDRVEGFILAAAGEAQRALTAYQSAYGKSSGEGRAVVAHFMAGHLARNLHDVQGAIDYAREAHAELQSGETAVSLGNYLVWSGQFKEGIALIESAISAAEGRARLIAVSSLAEGYRRWAEYARDHERNPAVQFARASKGLTIALATLESGVSDARIREIAAACAATALQGASAAARDAISLPGLGEFLEEVTRSLVRFTGAASWSRLCGAAQALSRGIGAPVAAQRLTRVLLEVGGETEPLPNSGRSYRGEVVNLQAAYGFIRHPQFPANIFFHSTDMHDGGGSFEDLRTGMIVGFLVVEQERGLRAVDVHVA